MILRAAGCDLPHALLRGAGSAGGARTSGGWRGALGRCVELCGQRGVRRGDGGAAGACGAGSLSVVREAGEPAMADGTDDVDALKRQIADLQVELRKKELKDIVFPYSRSYGRALISTILHSPDEGVSLVGQTLRVGGWVKTGREAGAGAFAFLEVNDGSCFENIQVVLTAEVAAAVGGLKDVTGTGTSVLVEGELAETPQGTKQKVELKASRVVHLGRCDNSAGNYPLAKKKQSFEFLREKMHLRARSNTIGAMARIRAALAFATHDFFRARGFLYVHTPIITAADCEGAGEMFQVTTLLSKIDEVESQPQLSPDDLKRLEEEVAHRGESVRTLKAKAGETKAPEDQAAAKAATAVLLQGKQDLANAQELARFRGGLPRGPNGRVDYGADFFGRPSFLTVSGQLNAEYFASALSNVYTFGPTFRAEDSHTSRHLAEFWMIEPEMVYCTLEDAMRCAEDYVQHCCSYLLENCRSDLDFMDRQVDKGASARLRAVAVTPFKRLSYTEAVEVLQGVVKAGKKKFEYKVEWGIDLQSEHERYLTEEVYKQPVIVYDYPRGIKAFYMRGNADGKTVAAMDVLVPKVGELIGGSQREERLEVLEARMEELGMETGPYSGYLDLRRYGSVPHAGFGLGFERLILFATGMENIRDVIPFPRWPGHADC